VTPESNELKEKKDAAQKQLVEFLQSDLDLCFTMLDTVEIATDPVHTRSLLRHVNEGLLIIRRLSGRIEDPEVWKVMHERSNELDRALEPFKERSREET
jgi:hypothetical protein